MPTPTPAIDLDTAPQLRAVIGRLARRLRPTETAVSAGLTPTRITVLQAVTRRGPLRLSELAASEGINPTMLSRVTADLVDAGLLERASDEGDRRAAWVAATAAGKRLAERIRRERTDAVSLALSALSDDERETIERALPALEAARRTARRRPPVTRVVRAGRITFAALSVRNYRRYYAGQAISLIGTWMQMTAQSWLVLTLTHSGAALGAIVALQTLPVLLLAPYGGVIADRIDKRRLMIVLQSAMGVQALVLGILTVTGAVRVWEVGVLAALLGLNNAFESPARQSFMLELVGADHLRNAVTLNSVLVNVARTIGPAVAGVLIATVGEGICFFFNAGSFVAVVFSLLTMDRMALNPTPPTPRARGQLREGLRYVRSTPGLAVPLLMMAAVGCLTYEFQVSLPVMASRGLHVGATGYGFMTAAMGVGAVVGGLMVAARGRTGVGPLVVRGLRVRHRDDAGHGGPRPGLRARGAGAGRRREHRLHVHRQLDPAAEGGAQHARPRDVAVVRRLPGLHPDRRPDRGRRDGVRRRPRRPRPRRHHMLRRGPSRPRSSTNDKQER